jgi:hypothetical protein
VWSSEFKLPASRFQFLPSCDFSTGDLGKDTTALAALAGFDAFDRLARFDALAALVALGAGKLIGDG